jgi:hypothetical protein
VATRSTTAATTTPCSVCKKTTVTTDPTPSVKATACPHRRLHRHRVRETAASTSARPTFSACRARRGTLPRRRTARRCAHRFLSGTRATAGGVSGIPAGPSRHTQTALPGARHTRKCTRPRTSGAAAVVSAQRTAMVPTAARPTVSPRAVPRSSTSRTSERSSWSHHPPLPPPRPQGGLYGPAVLHSLRLFIDT